MSARMNVAAYIPIKVITPAAIRQHSIISKSITFLLFNRQWTARTRLPSMSSARWSPQCRNGLCDIRHSRCPHRNSPPHRSQGGVLPHIRSLPWYQDTPCEGSLQPCQGAERLCGSLNATIVVAHDNRNENLLFCHSCNCFKRLIMWLSP